MTHNVTLATTHGYNHNYRLVELAKRLNGLGHSVRIITGIEATNPYNGESIKNAPGTLICVKPSLAHTSIRYRRGRAREQVDSYGSNLVDALNSSPMDELIILDFECYKKIYRYLPNIEGDISFDTTSWLENSSIDSAISFLEDHHEGLKGLIFSDIPPMQYFREAFSNLHISDLILPLPDSPAPNEFPNLKERFGIPKDKKIILYQGYLSSEKNLLELVASTFLYPDNWILLIMGEGPYARQLKKMSDSIETYTGRQSVSLHTQFSYSDYSAWPYIADIGCIPYTSESESGVFAPPLLYKMYAKAELPFLVTNMKSIQRALSQTVKGCILDEYLFGKSVGKFLQNLEKNPNSPVWSI